MASTEALRNVPKSKVPEVVKGYLRDGATKIDIRKQASNGRWTVKATFVT